MGRILLLIFVGCLLGAPATAEIYQWTDADGRTHFTDRLEDVPAAQRRDIREDLAKTGRVNVIEGLNPPTAPRAAVPVEGGGEDAELTWAEFTRASGGAPAGFPSADATAEQALGGLAAAFGVGLVGILLLALLGLAVGLAVFALCIKLAARICGQEVPGFGRAFAIAGVQMLAGMAAGVLLMLVIGFSALQDPSRSLQIQGSNMALSFGVNAAVLRAMWSESMGGAFVLALVSSLVALGLGIGVALLAALAMGGMALLGA